MNKQLFAIIAIIGLSLVFTEKKENCSVLNCSTTDVSTTTGTCGTATKNTNGTGFTVNLQTCQSGYYCPSALTITATAALSSSGSASVSCVKDPNSSFWSTLTDLVDDILNKQHCLTQPAGESCSDKTHCKSGTCTSSKCVGVAADGTCAVDEDCNVGLYCDAATKKCAAQKAENATCTRDLECINTHGCSNSKCIKYYSLASLAESTNPSVCSTLYIRTVAATSTTTTAKTVCDTATLTSTKCSDTEDSCVYTYVGDTTKTLTTTCQCDSTHKTMTVSCPAFDTTKKTVHENIHTSLRWTGSCTSIYSSYDSCTGEVYYGALYTNNSTIYKVGFVLLAALIILF